MLVTHATPPFLKCLATGRSVIISKRSRFTISLSSWLKKLALIQTKSMLPVSLVTKNTVFQKTMKPPKFGKKSLKRLASTLKSLKSALPKMATNVASSQANVFSSMMTTKTGGAVAVVVKTHQLVIRAVQIQKCFMISAKTSKTLKNTVSLTQLQTALALWKSATKFLCSIVVCRMAPLKN